MAEPSTNGVSVGDVRSSWESLADWWDAQVGEGNLTQRVLLWPVAERLLDLRAGDRLLEVACGNGSFARRMSLRGVDVVAIDLAERFLEIARGRAKPGSRGPEYQRVDVTSRDQLDQLAHRPFDAIACLMGLMDIPDIDPLLQAAPRLLRPGGRFVFAVTPPCFNGSGVVRQLEETDAGGRLEERRSVRVTQYATPRVSRGLGIPGQPAPHFYFDRPLGVLLGSAFRAGLVVDAVEEPTFPATQPAPRPLSWAAFPEFPLALIVRLRVG